LQNLFIVCHHKTFINIGLSI